MCLTIPAPFAEEELRYVAASCVLTDGGPGVGVSWGKRNGTEPGKAERGKVRRTTG